MPNNLYRYPQDIEDAVNTSILYDMINRNEMMLEFAKTRFNDSMRSFDCKDMLFDIFRDQSKIAGKSDVSIATLDGGDADGVAKLILYNIDDFEDGNIAGWTGDTANFSADNTTVISGTYSGKLSSSNAENRVISPSVSERDEDVWFSIRIGSDTANAGDEIRVVVYDSGSTELGRLMFEDSTNDLIWNDGVENVLSAGFWSPDTNYKVELRIDYTTDTVDIYVDGSQVGTTQNLRNSVSGSSYIYFTNETSLSGATRDAWIDNITVSSNAPNIDGQFWSIEKDLGYVPDNVVISDDVILNTEDVHYTVKDGAGNALTVNRPELNTFVDISTFTDPQIHILAYFQQSGGNVPELYEFAAYFK